MPGDSPNEDVTRLLRSPDPPTPADRDELLRLVYEQLRRIAQQRMAEERGDHTLQATALVHEAWLRLAGARDVEWRGRAHFFAAAAEAMRRILVEHARKRGAAKRGGGRRAISDVVDLAREENLADAVMIDELISRLESENAEAARVVRLRFFAGLSLEETAEILGVSLPTVSRRWTYARAWMASRWESENG